MRRTVAFALVYGAVLAAACSSFTSTDDPNPASPDASSDASNDAVPTDAPALPDAAPPPDGPLASSFCADAGAHDFCDDFDGHSLAASGWQAGQQSAADAGLSLLDMAYSTSPPSSLSTTLSTVGFTTQRSFFLKKNLAKGASKKVVVTFDLLIAVLQNQDAGARDADSLVIGIDDGMYGNGVRVANAGGQLRVSVEESISATQAYYDPAYTFGGSSFDVTLWHHFELTADRQTNTLALRIDNIAGAPPANTMFHLPSGTSGALGLSVGAQTDSSGETIKVYFDNVTVDLDR